MARVFYRTFIASLTISVTAGAGTVTAQVCHGTPTGRSIAYERGELSTGTTNGVSLALAGRTAFDANLRHRELDNNRNGNEVNIRFAFTFGVSKLQLCPGIGLGYRRDEWDAGDQTSLTTNELSGRAGAGVGLEQPVYRGLSVIPFVVVQYEFRAIHYDVDGPPNAEIDITGDTLSRVDIEYGLMARYKFVYAGIAAQRNTDMDGTRPYMARYLVGVTFGGSSSSARTRAGLPAGQSR